MKKQLLALAMAGAMLLGGCQPTYNENDPNYPGTTQPEPVSYTHLRAHET